MIRLVVSTNMAPISERLMSEQGRQSWVNIARLDVGRFYLFAVYSQPYASEVNARPVFTRQKDLVAQGINRSRLGSIMTRGDSCAPHHSGG
jgi:hypothetical protein